MKISVPLFCLIVLPLFSLRVDASEPKYSTRVLPDGSPATLIVNQKKLKKVSSVIEIRFDEVQFNSNNKSRELSFDLPPGAVSFAINIYPRHELGYTYVDSLTNPKGEEVISNHPKNIDPLLISNPLVGNRGQRLSLNAMHPEVFQQISSTPVPNHPKVRVQPGKWKLIVATEEKPIDVNVVILVKVLQGSMDSKIYGSVNLNISATPLSNYQLNLTDLRKKLTQVIQLYESFGVVLNITSVKNLNSEFDSTSDSATLKPVFYETLLNMMKMNSNKNRIPALDIYFVKRNNYSNQGIANYNGATGIFSSGSEKFSGIVVWTEAHLDSAATLAHELGHHFGLYHTNMDSLNDTFVSNFWLGSDQGYKPNLMHVGGGGFILSKQQQEVIRRNVALALYRELP